MPKGSNPQSWNNKPTIPGLHSSEISLQFSQWDFLQVIGQNNKSRGGREVVRAMQIIAKRNWEAAAEMLQVEATPEEIAQKLLLLFPDIKSGKKTHLDFITEIALGESSLAWSVPLGYYRVVNLAKIKVLNGDRHLVETSQILESGEPFPRNLEGVAEKIQYPETPLEAAIRGLQEELGVVSLTLISEGEPYLERNPVSKYKGIESYAMVHNFQATLKPDDIRDEYVEDRDGVKTVFRWKAQAFSDSYNTDAGYI